MAYAETKVMKAFEIYAVLAKDGHTDKEALNQYIADDEVRGLVDSFAYQVDCITLIAGDTLYLLPETKFSPFHMSNDTFKRKYLRAKSTNADLYLLYFTVIVLFACFYDSYQTRQPTREFLPLTHWMQAVDERIAALKEHSDEELMQFEAEFSYNWRDIIQKWDDMNDVKESAKQQKGQTISRMSFMHQVQNFLEAQNLIAPIGNGELQLTEKAKTVVQRYFMDVEYNNGILAFLYEVEEELDAGD
ncbi:DUF6063 family protein [Salisediminibacterium halotolerans]|uniref:Non-ribosomal peptide synthetase module n=1 Tax=Salisediminibacterium halotolerans TaxID=517425 RepID=A0A1H9SYY6_9BACI|nr:DUF6063 family protein [Salisediminibacterium haloalkalitolerans]SER90222.1 hypothetical protein SAMN05444126_10876 [Salisediminibacterium haloalkalitolerans]